MLKKRKKRKPTTKVVLTFINSIGGNQKENEPKLALRRFVKQFHRVCNEDALVFSKQQQANASSRASEISMLMLRYALLSTNH